MKVFQGFFVAPAYENKEQLLGQDRQTEQTWSVVSLAEKLGDQRDLATFSEIISLMKDKVVFLPDDSRKRRFDIPVSCILGRDCAIGSVDTAVLFASIARAAKIPCVVVDSVHENWNSSSDSEPVQGRAFVEALIQNKWVLVDPENALCYPDYDTKNWNLPGGYKAFAKGLSFGEMNVMTKEDRDGAARKAFQRADQNSGQYIDPNYRPLLLQPQQPGERRWAPKASCNVECCK